MSIKSTALKPIEHASVLIVGVVRNCEHTLEPDLDRLARAFAAAKDLAFFVVESDSSDATLAVLQQLAEQKPRFAYETCGQLAAHMPERTARIAYCRNRYLQVLREHSDYQGVDLVVVADFDGVNTKICAQAVHSCWMRADWDVCAANQSGPYYDVWALRHALWSPNDCWQQASFLRARGVSSFRAQRLAVYGRMLRLPSSAGWIEVDSAFGGLALYRRPCLEAVRYVGLDSAGEQICEHVALHQQIRAAGGQIVINPALINAGVVEHAVPATLFGTVKLWLGCRVRAIKRRLRGS